MIDTIIYKHNLDRTPTIEDRNNKVGLLEFAEQLREKGWVKKEKKEFISLKHFDVFYTTSTGNKENHIEWKAMLID